ncbi:hypothetical protein [Pseudomonas citronellolis]|uniref:hypothetical protein n=1 Tax=Pseudomonas citronellolis TaxID=53408 RepID=UPI0021BF8023|nr:hypothetical protein [Pseudomonas citronellolis]UXJ50128.1 hypothetical protein N5P21_19270 [Pseudomonas citronellolis]
MEPLHIGLTILIAIVVFGTAINYFDQRLKPGQIREQAERGKRTRRPAEREQER